MPYISHAYIHISCLIWFDSRETFLSGGLLNIEPSGILFAGASRYE